MKTLQAKLRRIAYLVWVAGPESSVTSLLRRVPALLLYWLVPVIALSGQARPSPNTKGARCQFDTAAVQDTLDITVGLGLPLDLIVSPRQDLMLRYFARAVARAFVSPATMNVEHWPGTHLPRALDKRDPALSPEGEFGLGGSLVFYVTSLGTLADTLVLVDTDSPELNLALIQAVRRADSASTLPPLTDDIGPDGVIALRIIAAPKLPRGSFGLTRTRFISIRVDRPVEALRIPLPQLPMISPEPLPPGKVELHYIVDASGKAVPGSIRVASGAIKELARAAVKSIRAGSFKPASVRGCPVAMAVRQQVVFKP